MADFAPRTVLWGVKLDVKGVKGLVKEVVEVIVLVCVLNHVVWIVKINVHGVVALAAEAVVVVVPKIVLGDV